MGQQHLQLKDAIFVGRLAGPCESCSPTIAEGLDVFVFHRGQVEIMTGQGNVPQLLALAGCPCAHVAFEAATEAFHHGPGELPLHKQHLSTLGIPTQSRPEREEP